MKKSVILLCSIGIMILAGCKENECLDTTVSNVFPFYSSNGGSVLIKGTGFNETSVVRFDRVTAEIMELNSNYISTKVPDGILGVVDISVANGSCSSSALFEVLSDLPANLPTAPPSYVIPPAGFSFPVQVGVDNTLYLKNVYDNTHTMEIRNFTFKKEIQNGEGEEKLSNKFHPVMGSIDLSINKFDLRIDRSSSGLPEENLVGGMYTMTLTINGEKTTDNFLIVFSTVDGRQYIFK